MKSKSLFVVFFLIKRYPFTDIVSVFCNAVKNCLIIMKRHNSSDDHDRECQNKETPKQSVNESASSSTSVKDILRCRIAQKQAQQNKEISRMS